jgi:hypothetical protein
MAFRVTSSRLLNVCKWALAAGPLRASDLPPAERQEMVESGWSGFEFADRGSSREAWPSDTTSPPASSCVYKQEEEPRSDNQGITYALSRIVTTPVTASSGI